MKLFCPKCCEFLCYSDDKTDQKFDCKCGEEVHIDEIIEQQQHNLMFTAIKLWQNAGSPTEKLNTYLSAAEASLENKIKKEVANKLSILLDSLSDNLWQVIAAIQSNTEDEDADEKLRKAKATSDLLFTKLHDKLNRVMPPKGVCDWTLDDFEESPFYDRY